MLYFMYYYNIYNIYNIYTRTRVRQKCLPNLSVREAFARMSKNLVLRLIGYLLVQKITRYIRAASQSSGTAKRSKACQNEQTTLKFL